MAIKGNIYKVRRPDDGLVVPLTCSEKQLTEVWIPKGYQLVGEESVSEDEGDKPKRSRKSEE